MRIIDVAAGLVFRQGKVLITRRKADEHLGGLWEFPGGKRDLDESFPDCLRRELREELGIEVEVKELLESLVHHYPEQSVRLEFYRCLLLKNEPQPLGCQALAWAAPEELAHYSFPEADRRLLAKLGQAPGLWL